jgi:hypothetical protein
MKTFEVNDGNKILEVFATEQEAEDFIKNHPDADVLSVEEGYDNDEE